MEEVEKHNTPTDCWVVLYGVVFDLTKFAKSHPGGAKLVTDLAGMDGSLPFVAVHPKDMALRLLGEKYIMGDVDASTILPRHIAPAPPKPKEEEEEEETAIVPAAGGKKKKWEKPDIGSMLNSFDFEAVASHVMGKEGWAYYSSGADDEITLRENHTAFQRIWLKPRVLVNVRDIDLRSAILGNPCSLPLYVTATALGGLAHEDAEVAIVKATGNEDVHYMLPTLSSRSVDEMLQARAPGQVVFSQLYVNPDRSRNLDYIRKLEAAGVKALFVTVDAPQLGRREKDMRNKFKGSGSNVQTKDDKSGKVDRNQGVTRAISSYIDPALCWEDIQWFKQNTNMAIILKGVQSDVDAVAALKAGVQGIVCSNHGGRQLDMSRSGIEILPEVMAALVKEPSYNKNTFQVFVDGGVRRGADIFKAIALGATAVGIGRPALYSLAAYGQPGVERMLQIFKDELVMCMRLMGTPTIADIGPNFCITESLGDHSNLPRDHLMLDTYQPLKTQTRARL